MGWSPLGHLQDPAQHDLAIRVQVTSWDEAQAGVEAERISLTHDVAGQKLGSPGCPYEVDHLSHGLLPVTMTLVLVVDEQFPEEERAVVVGRRSHDVPRHHDEADRLLAGVDHSAPGIVCWFRSASSSQDGTVETKSSCAVVVRKARTACSSSSVISRSALLTGPT